LRFVPFLFEKMRQFVNAGFPFPDTTVDGARKRDINDHVFVRFEERGNNESVGAE
jgi:hypothetical protein